MLIAAACCAVVAVCFAAFSEDCRHWFIIPTALCGVLMGVDAVDWARGRINVLDSAGLIGLFGVYFFFIAPLLHISQDHVIADWSWLVETPPPDWRPWIGMMACLNFAGLLFYRVTMTAASKPGRRDSGVAWELNESRFPWVIGAVILIAALAQYWILSRFGGFASYISTFEEEGNEAFEGLGRLFLLGESLPILLVLGYVLIGRHYRASSTTIALVALLAGFLLTTIVVGGLRGARSYTILNLFWAVGMIHYCLRRITKPVVAAGLVFLVVFMYGYGFYKWGGTDVVQDGSRQTRTYRLGRRYESQLHADDSIRFGPLRHASLPALPTGCDRRLRIRLGPFLRRRRRVVHSGINLAGPTADET